MDASHLVHKFHAFSVIKYDGLVRADTHDAPPVGTVPDAVDCAAGMLLVGHSLHDAPKGRTLVEEHSGVICTPCCDTHGPGGLEGAGCDTVAGVLT